MLLKRLLLLSILCCFVYTGFTQTTLPVPRNIQTSIDKGTRTINGEPGKNYWQNTADYVLSINFDPISRQLSGIDNIHYINNSPDTLNAVLFRLYPNLYKEGAVRSQEVDADDLTDGVQIAGMNINGVEQNVGKIDINGTNMRVPLTEKLLPGKSLDFKITYTYKLNKGSHIRTGEIEPGADFVAYFFPRIAVYDDIDGWNQNQYNGLQEFYNDFCNFKASITVPNGYVVWATGNLLNCNDVLMPPYCDRIKQAEQSDDITTIIDSTDLQKGNITTNNSYNTWKFEANDVTDFVFATSNHYIWKSSSLVVDKNTGRRTRVDAAFNPKHKDYFAVIDHARATVQHMSFDFPKWPYPYPHETVFDGLDQMEYPMMVNDNPLEDVTDEIELTDHEIFHTMFPFYMGINETKYAWMDEGWATIGEWLISPMIDSTIEDDYGVKPYEQNANKEIDAPIISLSTQQSGVNYFLNSYPKPAFGYLYVKDMLGDDVFYKGLHYYIEQWHGKHPMPYDFFNCMNKGTGIDLNWFWKNWFFETGFPNLAITNVTHNAKHYKVQVTSVGNKMVPVDLTIYYADGTKQLLHRNIAVWQHAAKNVTLSFDVNKTVQKLELGSIHIPDTDHSDNVYEVK